MTDSGVRQFQKLLQEFYQAHGRHSLPWRVAEQDGSFDPYNIWVSEIMLQQTQVPRVIPKYLEFIARFPDVATLASASLGEVLTIWNGLGYNRRAKFLHLSAQQIMAAHKGMFPRTMSELIALPGIGHNTAGAISAYAFNEPTVFIETNVRTVYIHHFFPDQTSVGDADILPLLEQTLDASNPRLFYWALMDYGTHLKQTVGNLARSSKHYTRQSKFEGSRRQVRGAVIRTLTNQRLSERGLARLIADEHLSDVLITLQREGMITIVGGKYAL